MESFFAQENQLLSRYTLTKYIFCDKMFMNYYTMHFYVFFSGTLWMKIMYNDVERNKIDVNNASICFKTVAKVLF